MDDNTNSKKFHEETANDVVAKSALEETVTLSTATQNFADSVPSCCGYPISIAFIVGNEFCERFSFYGMKAILPLYLTASLGFTENTSTTIIHCFNFSAYFFALLGGALSDNYLGKFKTILYLSVIYCVGSAVMSVTSIPGITGTNSQGYANWWGMASGLILIAIGTGGIKPCVSTFGGDQFLPHQVKQLAFFFSVFYFTINAGSVLSMFLTPLLRGKVHCFEQESCYPLAFGVPSALMFIALIIFVAGSKLYRKLPVSGSVVTRFFGLLWTGISRKVNFCKRNNHPVVSHQEAASTTGLIEPLDVPQSHTHSQSMKWLDKASDNYDAAFIEDSKSVLKTFTVFLPICFFWALYDQQGSRWVYQAVMMNSTIHLWGDTSLTIMPEQMGLVNAILILILIPVFTRLLYPALERVGCPLRSLTKILLGMIIGMISFLVAAVIQFFMASQGTFAPSPIDPSTMVCVDGCVSILWQLPQYFLITCAEVFLSLTGLEFSYSQAPASMRSVCQSGWLLTVAGGNLVVVIVSLINPVGWLRQNAPYSMAWDFILWSIIMAVASIWFVFLMRGFQYREEHSPKTDAIPPETITIVSVSAKEQDITVN